MTPAELKELVALMRDSCLTSLSVGGVSLTMDPRGFAVQPVPQTMIVPPKEVPPEVQELFRPMTDEEMLLMGAAPLTQSEASQ